MKLSHGGIVKEFTKIWSVATNGNDTTGDGSEGAPYATIAKAMNSAGSEDAILLGEGVFAISSFSALLSLKKLSIFGVNGSTSIEVQTCIQSEGIPSNTEVYLYNLKIRPANTMTGDARFLMYASGATGAGALYKIRAENVVFEKSLNNTKPTSSFFIYNGSTSVKVDVVFTRCSFKFTAQSYTGATGLIYISCALTVAGGGVYGTSVTGATYDSGNHLTSHDNGLYGVYSGDGSWDDIWSTSIIKLLVLSGGNLFAHDVTGWENLGVLPVDIPERKALYNARGMASISLVQAKELATAIRNGKITAMKL